MSIKYVLFAICSISAMLLCGAALICGLLYLMLSSLVPK